MGFVHTILNEVFQIDSIVTLHYFEFAKNYVFEGERHDFWECVYVDKGEIEIIHNDYRLIVIENPAHKRRDSLPPAGDTSRDVPGSKTGG